MNETVYIVPKPPESCDKCGRKSLWMKKMYWGLVECSYIDCPHRKQLTADYNPERVATQDQLQVD